MGKRQALDDVQEGTKVRLRGSNEILIARGPGCMYRDGKKLWVMISTVNSSQDIINVRHNEVEIV